MEIGEIIKEQRNQRGRIQEELAAQFFVSRQLISKWENGRSYPDLEQLIKLSDYFQLSLDELMRGDQIMRRKLMIGLKKKNYLSIICSVLSIIVLVVGYYAWSESGLVQLKPEDFEVVSIKKKAVPQKIVANIESYKQVVLKEDIEYVIKLKLKKTFVKMETGYIDILNSKADKQAIYLDVRGAKTLANFWESQTVTIFIYSDSGSIDRTVNQEWQPRINKGKEIRISNIEEIGNSLKSKKPSSWQFISIVELAKVD